MMTMLVVQNHRANMKNLKLIAAACAAALVSIMAASPSQAALVNWTLSNGLFDDGGTFSGAFTIDTTADTVTNWNIVTTAGTGGFAATYAPGGFFSSALDNGGSPVFTQYLGGPFGVGLEFTNLPFLGSGKVLSLAGDETVLFVGLYPVADRAIVQGTASAVPEPGEWAMMLVGLGVMGAVLRRRHGATAA
jgi:hypothetical protein